MDPVYIEGLFFFRRSYHRETNSSQSPTVLDHISSSSKRKVTATNIAHENPRVPMRLASLGGLARVPDSKCVRWPWGAQTKADGLGYGPSWGRPKTDSELSTGVRQPWCDEIDQSQVQAKKSRFPDHHHTGGVSARALPERFVVSVSRRCSQRISPPPGASTAAKWRRPALDLRCSGASSIMRAKLKRPI